MQAAFFYEPMMSKLLKTVTQFIESHHDAVAVLIYFADFKMPNTRSINKRREEVAKWILRECGHETLAYQQLFEPPLDASVAEQENKRDKLIKQILAQFEHIAPVSEEAFLHHVGSLKENQEFLKSMLATGGSILVYGTPETYDFKPLYVSQEERDLLRKMQKIWGIQ